MANIVNYRNPARNRRGGIDIELDHPLYGWIPFTATPSDEQELGRAIYAEIEASGVEITPYVPPPAEELLAEERAGMVISAFQAKAMLLQAGYWEDVAAFMADADPVTRLAWETAREFRRLSPTILEIAEILEITDEQLDDLFRFAATIEA